MQFDASRNGFVSFAPGATAKSSVETSGVFVGLDANTRAFANDTMSRASRTSPVAASTMTRGAVGRPAGTFGRTA